MTAATDLADAPIKTDSNGFLDVLKQTCITFSFLITVKFLNWRTPENFAIQSNRPNLRVFRQNDANGIANNEDPDQTARLGAV